jgi:hypothetical protein
MKTIARIFSALSLTALVFLTGCAITPPTTMTKNEAARLSTTVATPGVDGVAVTAAVLDFQEIDPKTGQNTGGWKRTVHLFNSLPLGGELLKGVLGGTGAALIQRDAAKEVANINATCGGKGCVGGPGVVVNSISQSISQTEVGVNSSVGIGSCGAACIPGRAD